MLRGIRIEFKRFGDAVLMLREKAPSDDFAEGAKSF